MLFECIALLAILSIPLCQTADCLPPATPGEIRLTGGGTVPGSVYRISCTTPGHTLTADSPVSSTCLSTGQWSADLMTAACHYTCPSIDVVPDGLEEYVGQIRSRWEYTTPDGIPAHKKRYAVGSTASMWCEDGRKTRATLTCTLDGWDPPGVPQCLKSLFLCDGNVNLALAVIRKFRT